LVFRFLHTSDLHLGKRFGRMPEALRGRLTEARHDAIARLGDIAGTEDLDAILVAGDIFDTETPSPATVRQALRSMGETPEIRWYLIPGNHDSLQAEELWNRVEKERPDNVLLLNEPEPVDVGHGAVLLPTPCPTRRPGRDLTDWMSDAATPDGKIRIGLAHGPIQDFGEDGGSDVIAPDRAALSKLDYLALGDWHGQIRVNERTWYSGTPEPDRFKHDAPGQALVVEIDAPGAVPRVKPVTTGRFLWKDLALNLVADEDPTERLTQSVAPLVDRRNILLQLAAIGRVGLEAKAAIADAAREVDPDFAWMRFDETALTIEHRPDDLDLIDRAGALRQAADDLLREAQDSAVSSSTARVAERALSRLYAYSLEYEA
jgi:DNA repair exonuclease SbcCD nuclease subunit